MPKCVTAHAYIHTHTHTQSLISDKNSLLQKLTEAHTALDKARVDQDAVARLQAKLYAARSEREQALSMLASIACADADVDSLYTNLGAQMCGEEYFVPLVDHGTQTQDSEWEANRCAL